MSLLAMAALGGTDKSANGVAAKIREEAKQAFQERMSDKQFDQAVQMEGIRHSNNVHTTQMGIDADNQRAKDNREHESDLTDKRIGANKDEGVLNRKHDSKEADKGRKWQSSEKKKDRTHDLELEVKQLERAASKAGSSSNQGEQTRKAYELLIQKKYELHDSLSLNNEKEKAAVIWSDIVRLEEGMRTAFGVNMPSPEAPTLETLTTKILAANKMQDTPENRKKVQDGMRDQPKFAAYFNEPNKESEGDKSDGKGGLLNVQPTEPKPASAPNPATNPLLSPLASRIAAQDSKRSSEDKANAKADMQRQREYFADDLEKGDMDLRKASQEMAQAYSKIANGAGGSLTAVQLARLHDIIESLRTSGMTDAENSQAKAILDYIESRS